MMTSRPADTAHALIRAYFQEHGQRSEDGHGTHRLHFHQLPSMLDTLPAELVLPDQQDRLRLVAMCAEAVEHDHAATLSVEEAVHLIELVVADKAQRSICMNADSSDTPVLLHPGAASTPNLVNVNEEDDDDVEKDDDNVGCEDASALDSRLLMPGAVESPYLINDEQPSGSGEISTVSAFPATPAPPQVWTQRLLNKPSRTPASASLQRFAFSIAESMSTPNGNVNAAAAASSFRFLAEQNNDDAAVDTARKVSEHPTVSAVSSPLRHLDVSAIERISPPLDAPSEIVAGNRDDDNGDDSVVVNDRSLLEAMGVEEESAVNAANQFPGNQLGATTQPSVRRTLFPTNVTMRRRVDAAAEEEHGNSNTVLATPQQTGKQRVDVLEAYGEAVSQEKTSPTSKVDSDADTASRKLADLERTYKAQLTEKDALVQDMETRLAQLDATVERLTRDISDGRAVERRHIEQIHALEETRNSLMSELEAWKEAHASLKTQLDELRNEETHLRSMVEAGEQQMLQQKAHIAELESNLVMSSDKRAQLESQIAHFESELELTNELQAMLDATHLENQRLAAEVARVTADLEDVRAAAGAADVKNGDVVAVANRSLHSELMQQRNGDEEAQLPDTVMGLQNEHGREPSPVRVLRTEITSLQDKLEHAEFKAACLEKQNATSVRFTGTLDDYTRHLEEEVGSLQMQLRDAWAKWDREHTSKEAFKSATQKEINDLSQQLHSKSNSTTPNASRGVSFAQPSLFDSPAGATRGAKNPSPLRAVMGSCSPILRSEDTAHDGVDDDSFVTVTGDKSPAADPFSSVVGQSDLEEVERRRSGDDEGKRQGKAPALDQAYTGLFDWFEKLGDGVEDLERNAQELERAITPTEGQPPREYAGQLADWLAKLKTDVSAVLGDTLAELKSLRVQKSKYKKTVATFRAENMQLKATLVSITTENGTLRGELEALSADYARVSGAKAEVDRVVDRLRHELAEQLEQAAAMEAQLEEATKERKVTSFTGISAAVQTDGAMSMLPPSLSTAPLTPAATPHAASGQKMTEIIRKRNQEVAECKARIAQLEQELARQTSANEPKRGRQSLVDMRPPGIAMGIQAVPNSKTQSAQTDGADATPPLPSTAVLPSTALLEKLSADLEKLSSDDGLRQRRDASATTTFASTPRPTVFSSVSTAFSLSLYSIVLWSFGALVGVWLVASLLRANVIRVRDGMEPHPFDAVAATDDWINAYSSAIGGRGLNTLKFEPYDLGLDDDTEANDGEAEKGWVGALLDWVRHGKDEEAETQEDDGRNALPVYRGEPTMDSGIPV